MNILITGGSSGLGRALVEKFAMGKDNHVGFTFCSKKANAEELMSRFCNVSSYKVDYCDNQGVDLFVDLLSGVPVDVLINNVYSGKAQGTHFHKTDFVDFETSFHENIIPFIKINQACLAGMRKRKYGKIVNILTSYLIDVPPAGFSVYTATKAYIRQLSKCISKEYGIYRNSLLNFTFEGAQKVPNTFFTPFKSHPVFPPTQESTCASSVVGIFTNSMPRI